MIHSYERDVDSWLPVYWRWTFHLVQLVESLVNLFIVWFGIELDISLPYMTWVMNKFTVSKTRKV